jgi:large subunit ribosomal protein L3
MDVYYAHKTGNAHTYDTNGKRLLITKLSLQDLVITQVKSVDKDGYKALQVGIGTKKSANKPEQGKFKELKTTPRNLKEIALTVETETDKKTGEVVSVGEVLTIGDIVSVHSVSKGKGFAGGVKRWGFAGGPKTHGQSDRHRAPGSIGQGTTPGRVHRGKKMAGRMGSKVACVRGGQVVNIDSSAGEIWITGTVPGAKGGLVTIKKLASKNFKGIFGKKDEPEVTTNPSTEPEVTTTNPDTKQTANTDLNQDTNQA